MEQPQNLWWREMEEDEKKEGKNEDSDNGNTAFNDEKFPPTRCVYVGNLNLTITQADLHGLLIVASNTGCPVPPNAVIIKKMPQSDPQYACAYVVFPNLLQAKAMFDLWVQHQLEIGSGNLTFHYVDEAKCNPKYPLCGENSSDKSSTTRCIYIAGFSSDLTYSKLRDFVLTKLRTTGVNSVVVKNRSDHSFAFITFSSLEDAQTASVKWQSMDGYALWYEYWGSNQPLIFGWGNPSKSPKTPKKNIKPNNKSRVHKRQNQPISLSKLCPKPAQGFAIDHEINHRNNARQLSRAKASQLQGILKTSTGTNTIYVNNAEKCFGLQNLDNKFQCDAVRDVLRDYGNLTKTYINHPHETQSFHFMLVEYTTDRECAKAIFSLTRLSEGVIVRWSSHTIKQPQQRQQQQQQRQHKKR